MTSAGPRGPGRRVVPAAPDGATGPPAREQRRGPAHLATAAADGGGTTARRPTSLTALVPCLEHPVPARPSRRRLADRPLRTRLLLPVGAGGLGVLLLGAVAVQGQS